MVCRACLKDHPPYRMCLPLDLVSAANTSRNDVLPDMTKVQATFAKIDPGLKISKKAEATIEAHLEVLDILGRIRAKTRDRVRRYRAKQGGK